jgi:hypothetical protein
MNTLSEALQDCHTERKVSAIQSLVSAFDAALLLEEGLRARFGVLTPQALPQTVKAFGRFR